MKLPRHISMRISHNPHAGDYQPLEEWLHLQIYLEACAGFSQDEFVSPADLAEILSRGEVWEINWNPDTPVGSCTVIAATLERALELACAGDDL